MPKDNRRQRLALFESGNTKCPICLFPFTKSEVEAGNTVTLEHVSPSGLPRAGRSLAMCLTCRECNHGTGRGVEQATIRAARMEATIYIAGLPHRAYLSESRPHISIQGRRAAAEQRIVSETLRRGGDMKLTATLPTRHHASVVYLKAAYLTVLCLLGKYGYNWAASSALRVVRAQIRSPKEEIIDRFAFSARESILENGTAINTRHATPCWAVKIGDCLVVLPPDTNDGSFYAGRGPFSGNDNATLGGGPMWFPAKFGRTRVGLITMREDFDPKGVLGVCAAGKITS